MTKIFTLFILSCCTTVLHAQINKGAILLGGQIAHAGETQESEYGKQETKGTTIDLSIGRAFRENAVMGINLNYTPVEQTLWRNYGPDTTGKKTSMSTIGAGAFYRRYKSVGRDFFFFTQAGAGLSFGKGKNPDKREAKVFGVSAHITPGLSYQAFRKVQLELSLPGLLALQYSKTKTEGNNQPAYENRQFSFSSSLTAPLQSLGVGFRFIF